ncbi:MAG: Uma2 family endonuclease [Saprospiraceae bacterium]|nr:Uma2 family endonuclease [Saprospiraceae bacterium]
MTTKARAKAIPEYLIYEMDDGNPIYYNGYEEVLDGKKNAEAIMADGNLQALLKALIITTLNNLLSKTYIATVGEQGLTLAKKSWRAADVSIFKRENFLFTTEYSKLPPEIVIEIDTKAHIDLEKTDVNYYNRKIQQLLDFGVQKVIWIFTGEQKVMVAENTKDWITSNWDKTIDIMEGITLNIEQMLDEAKA